MTEIYFHYFIIIIIIICQESQWLKNKDLFLPLLHEHLGSLVDLFYVIIILEYIMAERSARIWDTSYLKLGRKNGKINFL